MTDSNCNSSRTCLETLSECGTFKTIRKSTWCPHQVGIVTFGMLQLLSYRCTFRNFSKIFCILHKNIFLTEQKILKGVIQYQEVTSFTVLASSSTVNSPGFPRLIGPVFSPSMSLMSPSTKSAT